MGDLRSLIREVLTEELASLRAAAKPQKQIMQETVSLKSDSDLNAFVRRILELGQDTKKRSDILAGRYIFQLGYTGSPTPYVAQPAPQAALFHSSGYMQPVSPAPTRAEFSKGMITERDVANLPQGTLAIAIGKSVRITPLARDELRRQNITIERAAP